MAVQRWIWLLSASLVLATACGGSDDGMTEDEPTMSDREGASGTGDGMASGGNGSGDSDDGSGSMNSDTDGSTGDDSGDGSSGDGSAGNGGDAGDGGGSDGGDGGDDSGAAGAGGGGDSDSSSGDDGDTPDVLMPGEGEEVCGSVLCVDPECCQDAFASLCGARVSETACIPPPPESAEADPRCPSVNIMGIFTLPSCCIDGQCGIDATSFDMPGCTDLETAQMRVEEMGAGAFIDIPPPQPCD